MVKKLQYINLNILKYEICILDITGTKYTVCSDGK